MPVGGIEASLRRISHYDGRSDSVRRSILFDAKAGALYLAEILRHHVSGQLKIAPEHVSDPVLNLMGKPGRERLEDFKRLFDEVRRKEGLKAFLTYYLMAAHPGCSLEDMQDLRNFAIRRLHLLPEQV